MNNAEQPTLQQSLTGGRDITVSKLKFDPCGCCPNVVGKICVDGEIDVENICVQGNVSSDKVIAGVGAGKGFHLSTDPCNSEGDTVLSNDLTNTTLDGGSTPLVLTTQGNMKLQLSILGHGIHLIPWTSNGTAFWEFFSMLPDGATGRVQTIIRGIAQGNLPSGSTFEIGIGKARVYFPLLRR